MAGLVSAIYVFPCSSRAKTWMPGTSPGMTMKRYVVALSDVFAAQTQLRLALGVEHRGTHGLGRGFSGPDHELERRLISFAGVDGADPHGLALRGRGGVCRGG